MSSKISIKCAELFWKPESSSLEYRCIVCKTRFYSETDFFIHIQQCLHVEISIESEFAESPNNETIPGTQQLDLSLSVLDYGETTHIKDEIEYIDEEHLIDTQLTDDDDTIVYSPPKSGPSMSHQPRQRKKQSDARPESKGLSFTRLLLSHLDPQNSKPLLSCELCGFRHHMRCRMLSHMERMHMGNAKKKKKYCCEICGVRMTEKGNLNVHRRIHTGERPFPCTIKSCDRRFVSSSEQKIHMRMHLDERPYTCDECPKAYRSKNILNMHKQSCHSDHRPYACEHCGRTFKLGQTYKDHMLTHSGLRPFHCEICGRSFRKRSTFSAHVNIHTDTRPYTCKLCDRGFHSSAARRSHEKTLHKLP